MRAAGAIGPVAAGAVLRAGLVGAALALLALRVEPALAQTLAQEREWLPPGSSIADDLLQRPRQVLAVGAAGGSVPFQVRLGELAFRSPEILGGNARRAGIACNSCHTEGHANGRFFVPGLAERPGTIDVTHRLWNPKAEDGLANPLAIPSLRGVADRAPFGFRGRFAELGGFTRHVIVHEFSGAEPPAVVLDALVAFQAELEPLPNPELGPGGRLAPGAAAAARRGEARFMADCSGCHQPRAGFQDGRRHDVGTGGQVRTPTLLGLGLAAPFFHDGRHVSMAAALDDHTARLGLEPAPGERADLLAYLAAIGAGVEPTQPVTLERDLDRLASFVALLGTPLLDEDAFLAEIIGRMLRGEVGRIHRRFHGPEHEAARQVLAGWARAIAEVAALAEARQFPAARAALDGVQTQLAGERASLAAAAGTSLYDAAAVAEFNRRAP